ncbi:MAG: isochorismatase family cysteine hydrolase [Alphaproteobacteria bacterium]|jgi:nicotinamidase-related amidase|nr:isochorismatase family cysteine hydrolase [Alphaproteobacteria bacterium]MDP7640996.1 isochorismatase family cysteine hydrolase [Alphaproteobacteria bacterium]
MTLELDPRRTAVLPLDVQNDIVAMTPNVEPILNNVKSVVDAARGRDVPVVYVTVSFTEGYPDAPVKTHPLYKMVSENCLVLAAGSGAEIHASVAPKQDELVLNKTSVDPFVTTRLAQHLQIVGADTIVIMGFSTNFVVESTARTASDMGYRVVVVRDACGGRSDEGHEYSMSNFMPMFATIAGAEEVRQALIA